MDVQNYMSQSRTLLFDNVSPTDVTVTMAGHVFVFRRLTWRDDIRLYLIRQGDPDLHLLSFALTSVDGKPVDVSAASAMIAALPRPVRERLIIFYRGSLPSHRLGETKIPSSAPPPAVLRARVEAETEEVEEQADDYLERKFGREEAEAARAQGRAIAAATGAVGVTPALDEGGGDDYMAVM